MDLSLAQARRLALVAQGFGRHPTRPGLGDVRRVAAKVLAVQLDSVNVLVRSHYLPAYSRLGPYPAAAIDALAYRRRELFECWGHATCLMPVRLYPLLRYRMLAKREAVPWAGVEAVYDEVAERGPLAAGELSNAERRSGPWWGWSSGKRALEALLDCGFLAVSGRRGFTRLYDLTERVIPADVLAAPVPEPAAAQKELMCLAAGALGVATADQLGGYFGLQSYRVSVRGPDGKAPKPIWRRLLAELVEEGRLVPVTVEGWSRPGYVPPGTRRAGPVHERALLSPFDSFMRGSAKALCGFHQSLAQQLYVPAERRVYGYYVLPFLLGDTLVGRCDLKADRARGALLVQGAFHEEGQDGRHVAAELAQELRRLQDWLELDRIEVADRGELAPLLRRRLPRR